MIEISLNQHTTNRLNFIINSLKLLLILSTGETNNKEFKEILNKLIKKINSTNKIGRISIMKDSIEKLDKWCNKQRVTEFYNRIIILCGLYLELIKAHSDEQENIIEILTNKISNLFKILYMDLNTRINTQINHENFVQKLKIKLDYYN